MNLVKKVLLTTCVAVVTATSLAACSGPSKSEILQEELATRGFTDITVENSGIYQHSFWASAHGCRVYLQYNSDAYPGDEWLLIERSSKGKDYDVVVPNPTADKLGEIDAFDYCFVVDAQSSTTQ